MPVRKRRSNRLTPDQIETHRSGRQAQLHQLTIMIGFGQNHLDWCDSLYRSVSLQVALRMVRDGEAEQFEAATDNGTIVLFRELKPFTNVQYQLPTMPSAASAEAIAGVSDNRKLREHLIAFPFIGDTKAPLVMPRVSDRDRDAAHRLLGMRPATAGHCYRDTRVLRTAA